MEGDGLSAEQIEQNRGDAKIDKTMRMGYSGENPAAPKGRGAKKTPNVKYICSLIFITQRELKVPLISFPNKKAFSGKSLVHRCPGCNDFRAFASRFPIWGSFFHVVTASKVILSMRRFFSICSCPLLVKAKTLLSDIHLGGHGTQFTGTSRLFKFLPAFISGCLQTQAPTSLISYSWRVISFPRPQEIETDLKKKVHMPETAGSGTENSNWEDVLSNDIAVTASTGMSGWGSVFSAVPQGCN